MSLKKTVPSTEVKLLSSGRSKIQSQFSAQVAKAHRNETSNEVGMLSQQTLSA